MREQQFLRRAFKWLGWILVLFALAVPIANVLDDDMRGSPWPLSGVYLFFALWFFWGARGFKE